ncbi:MAG: hypothetical protein FWF13_00115 [Acidobacteria bacterium]|nr:hypothetical protein [Acidobacteriota bacterium]
MDRLAVFIQFSLVSVAGSFMAPFARACRRYFFGRIRIMAICTAKVLVGFVSDYIANLRVRADKCQQKN